MAENRLGVQTRSMVDAQCNEDQTTNPHEQEPVQEVTNNPTPVTENPRNPNPHQWKQQKRARSTSHTSMTYYKRWMH